MSIFNPYPNMSQLSIYKEKYMIFRIFIAFTGIFSLIQCVLTVLGHTFSILLSAYLPPFLIKEALESFFKEENAVAVLLIISGSLSVIFYFLTFYLSKKKYGFAFAAFTFYMLDTLVLVINVKNADISYIIGHLILVLIFVCGIITTKRLINAEREAEKNNKINKEEKRRKEI